MPNILKIMRDGIWDKLFLDFYLDKRWTIRFKLMNLISGDVLRDYLCITYHHINSIPDDAVDALVRLHLKKAKHWSNIAMNEWSATK